MAVLSSFGIEFDLPGTTRWTTLAMRWKSFLQRPYKQSDFDIVEYCKVANRPVWVDYDDLLWAVPTDNPSHHLYSDPETQKRIVRIIGMADVVSVSTEPLREIFQKPTKSGKVLNKEVRVIRNALNPIFTPMSEMFKKKQRKKVVLWRGSETHQRDLLRRAEDIISVANNNPDWVFVFVGYNPWFITDHLRKEQCIVSSSLDIVEYHSFLRNAQPAIMMVPLENHLFNECKSDIAYLEATWCGALTLCPGFSEWRRPGAVNYHGELSFKDLLCDMMKFFETNPEAFDAQHKLAANYVYSERNLHNQATAQRLKIVREVMKCSEQPLEVESFQEQGLKNSSER